MMDCRTFSLLLDKPETEWTQAERSAAEEHAARCADCRTLLAMRREMRAMDDDEQLPPSFSSSWRNQLHTEEKKMNGKILSFPWKRTLSAVAAVAVLAVGTTAVFLNERDKPSYTNSTARESVYAAEEAEYSRYAYDGGANGMMALGAMRAAGSAKETAEYEYDEYAAGDASTASARTAKIIRTVNFTIKTKQYEADYEAIRELTARYGGRIESLTTSGDGTAYSLRKASFTLRIPSERLDDFIGGARVLGSVSSYSENSEDVSDSYYDMQTRLETQRAKLQRLTELMAKAEDVSDLIEIENAVSDTQYWIDYYTGKMNGMNSRVSESTVTVTLRELNTAEPVEVRDSTLGERILSALEESISMAGELLQALVIFLIAALPWIAAAAVLILILRAVIRRRKARKQIKKEE